MIEEDYVSYEVAELLKEKGFDELCSCLYNKKTKERTTPREYVYNGEWEAFILCPTVQMTMKWLREEHNIFIGINTVIGSDKNWGYEAFIQKQEIPIPSKIQWDWSNTYKEACETAIRYALKYLI